MKAKSWMRSPNRKTPHAISIHNRHATMSSQVKKGSRTSSSKASSLTGYTESRKMASPPRNGGRSRSNGTKSPTPKRTPSTAADVDEVSIDSYFMDFWNTVILLSKCDADHKLEKSSQFPYLKNAFAESKLITNQIFYCLNFGSASTQAVVFISRPNRFAADLISYPNATMGYNILIFISIKAFLKTPIARRHWQ